MAEDRDEGLIVKPAVGSTISIAGFNLQTSDMIKLLSFAIAAAISWGTFQSEINALTNRLDKRESQDAIYLRSDVQTARDEVIMAQLRATIDRLDRIQKVLDGK